MTRPHTSHRLIRGPRCVQPRLAAYAALALTIVAVTGGETAAEPGAPGPGAIVLRAPAPPSPGSREQMVRWSRAWSGEWSRLSGPYRHLVATRRAGRPLAGLAACEALGRALLSLDRDRLFPVPDPAVERPLRRALDRLVGVSVECLRWRPHAAGHALDQAGRALGEARRALDRYRGAAEGAERSLAPSLHQTPASKVGTRRRKR